MYIFTVSSVSQSIDIIWSKRTITVPWFNSGLLENEQYATQSKLAQNTLVWSVLLSLLVLLPFELVFNRRKKKKHPSTEFFLIKYQFPPWNWAAANWARILQRIQFIGSLCISGAHNKSSAEKKYGIVFAQYVKLAFLFSHSKPFLCCALGRRVWEKQKDTARRLRDAVVQLKCEWTNEFKIKTKLKVKTTLYYKEYRPQNTATIRKKSRTEIEKKRKEEKRIRLFRHTHWKHLTDDCDFYTPLIFLHTKYPKRVWFVNGSCLTELST